MVITHNPSGRPLASAEWLKAHHRAKLPERRAFVRNLAGRSPKRLVDLGCGTGLWLSLFDEFLPPSCEFIGVDSDPDALALAEKCAYAWKRRASFELIDVDAEAGAIPEGDMTLSFNLFQYLADPAELLTTLADQRGTVAVRQYDGAALRFGPMDPGVRDLIERSLLAAVGTSEQFRHYDMDRVFELLSASPFSHREIDFELFTRTSPFPDEFLDYYRSTLEWTLGLVPVDAQQELQSWLEEDPLATRRYFFEVDLTGILS